MKKKPYLGNYFGERGYLVKKFGINEAIIKKYVKYQEEEEKKEEMSSNEFGLFQSQQDK